MDLLFLDTLKDAWADTITAWKGDEWVLVLTDNENVGDTSGELGLASILHVDDVEASHLLLDLLDDTNTTNVTTGSDHGDIADGELDVGLDFTGLDVELDGVVQADSWVAVGDGTAIVGDDVWDTLVADDVLVDAEELE